MELRHFSGKFLSWLLVRGFLASAEYRF